MKGEKGMAVQLAPANFYEEAIKKLEEKDLIEFMLKIGAAEALAGNDKEMISKISFLKAKGLYELKQYKKAVKAISEASKFISDVEMLTLRIFEGISCGFLGELDQAVNIFKTVIDQTEDCMILAKAYNNIAWINMTLDRDNLDDNKLEESKKYLDLANEHYDLFAEDLKVSLGTNYSVYYFYKKQYDEAIKVIQNSINCCNEEYLAVLYFNLSEIYLKIAENDNSNVADVAKEYLEKAEILATAHNNDLALGYIFYTEAMIELRADQLFTALDILYLSFEFFKKAEAHVKACDTLLKINKLMDEYKHNSLKSYRHNLKNKLKNTPYYNQFYK